jgi:Transposase DDE domain
MSITVADLAATLQSVFTTEADDAAAASGFSRRRRVLTGAGFVQALTFGWLANPKASLDDLAELAADLGCPVSPQALDQRFTPQAADCLSYVLHSALLRLVAACPVAAPLLQRFQGVYVRDCSTITLPGCLADLLPGCGHGKPEIPCSGVKLHVGLELGTGALENLSLQPARTSDRCCRGTHAPLPRGAILLEDLGFFDVRRLRHYAEQGCYVLSRAPTRLLVRGDGQRQKNLVKFLQGVEGDRVDCWVTIGRRQGAWRCRLIAVRVPKEVAQRRLERAEKEAKDLGRKLSGQKRALCEWTVLLTNAPAALLSVEEALALRRVRWQVELLFRLWKDEGKVDESRGKKPYRVLCELLAKLLGQVVQHWASLLAASPLEVSGVKAARRVRQRAARLAESLGALAALLGVLGRLRQRLRRRACRKRGRSGRPTTLEVVRQPELYGYGAAGASPPSRHRCEIPHDIAKALRAA